MVTGFCLSDVIGELRAEGLKNANPARIHHAIIAGHIARPHLDGSHRYRFTRTNVRQIRAYLQNVPRPGRRAIQQVS